MIKSRHSLTGFVKRGETDTVVMRDWVMNRRDSRQAPPLKGRWSLLNPALHLTLPCFLEVSRHAALVLQGVLRLCRISFAGPRDDEIEVLSHQTIRQIVAQTTQY